MAPALPNEQNEISVLRLKRAIKKKIPYVVKEDPRVFCFETVL